MANILGIGIATLDIINTVDGYPTEDTEVRALSQRVVRGGNTTNTLVVLNQLGHHCHWMGTLASEPDADRILDDLKRYHIDISRCDMVAGGKVPTSYILLNMRNGSRSIVHYRDLPELSFEHFIQQDLTTIDWLHFEGRNVEESLKMLTQVKQEYAHIPCSLEIEKPRNGIEQLFAYANTLIFSRVYLLDMGYRNPEQFLLDRHKQFGQTQIICPWGDKGAYGIDASGELHHAPAFPPPQLVDTLAAGDTFNAGVIDACLLNLTLPEILSKANRLAGHKCGIEGLHLNLSHE